MIVTYKAPGISGATIRAICERYRDIQRYNVQIGRNPWRYSADTAYYISNHGQTRKMVLTVYRKFDHPAAERMHVCTLEVYY